MVKQHKEDIKEMRDVFFKSVHSSINRVIKNLECSQAQRSIIILQMQKMMNEGMEKFDLNSGQIQINSPIKEIRKGHVIPKGNSQLQRIYHTIRINHPQSCLHI